MVSVAQGEVWWADLGDPIGSEPGFRRPVVIVQSNAFNRSAIATVLVVPLTSNLKWALAPGNVELKPKETSLEKASVANVSQLTTLDRSVLVERVGRLPKSKLTLVLDGIAIVLDRD
jgi:mRNA interferase MazF